MTEAMENVRLKLVVTSQADVNQCWRDKLNVFSLPAVNRKLTHEEKEGPEWMMTPTAHEIEKERIETEDILMECI